MKIQFSNLSVITNFLFLFQQIVLEVGYRILVNYIKYLFVSILGHIPQGLPDFELPPTSMKNGTVTFLEMTRDLGTGVLVLPLVGILENIAICKAFGKTLDVMWAWRTLCRYLPYLP